MTPVSPSLRSYRLSQLVIDLLFLRCLIPMAQMPSVRQIKAHQPLMWPHDRLIDLQICRTATQALYVDAPPLRIQPESLEGAGLTGEFDGVDVLIAAIIACARIAFGVLVRHRRPERVEDGAGGEILGGDEDDGLSLALDL